MLNIPELVVGTAARHGAVTVLPLFPAVPRPGVAYRLGAHALASGALEIHELRGGAVVDRLEARNRGGDRVLLVEGDHLLGSKQNRVVTSSALLGGRRTVTLPVSCVERGRWEGASHRFEGTGSVAPASVRRIIKQTVTSALLDQRGRAADQARIWSQIADQQHRLRVTSATCALEASYATCAGDLRPIAVSLPYAPRATGVAIGVAGELVSIDLFDQPATCAQYWRQLVEGAALEALGIPAGGGVGQREVEHLVARLRDAAWRPVPAVGDGEELRARTADASASALIVDGCIVHLGAAAGAALHSEARPMRRELPPELADRYRILSRLGVGGVKEVFRAADLRGGREVAIARIPYARRELIEREVETARRVQGPYVPQIHEAIPGAAAHRPPPAPVAATRPPRPAMTRVRQIPLAVQAPEHVLVAPCERVPLIALLPAAGATEIRALDAGGQVRWSRRVDARLTAGLRADLDGDGVRELYLAGPDRVIALERDSELRYARAPRGAAPAPTLAAIPDRVAPTLLVDGDALEPRTGLPRGLAVHAYEGDGRRLVAAPDPRGASYHGAALQAFRGAHGTAAAIVSHAHDRGFFVAHLEEEAGGRTVQVVIYGPGGARVRGLRVQHCELPTGDAAAIASLASRERRLFGPEHAPLAVLGPDGTAAVIVPLVAADPVVPSGIAAYALPDGRELWRIGLPARRGRAALGDVDGDGRPELVVGTGDGVLAYDPWTGAPRMELPGAGLPVAIGDPFASGFQHLVTVTPEGVELWRGQPCRPGAMQWSGLRGDLWRTGTVDAGGAPIGPL